MRTGPFGCTQDNQGRPPQKCAGACGWKKSEELEKADFRKAAPIHQKFHQPAASERDCSNLPRGFFRRNSISIVRTIAGPCAEMHISVVLRLLKSAGVIVFLCSAACRSLEPLFVFACDGHNTGSCSSGASRADRHRRFRGRPGGSYFRGAAAKPCNFK